MGDFPKTQGPVPDMPPVTPPRSSTTGIPFADELLEKMKCVPASLVSAGIHREIYFAVSHLLRVQERVDLQYALHNPATKETTFHE